MMQLKKPPIGKDYFETESGLHKLEKKLGLRSFARSELYWILRAPVGPLPNVCWGNTAKPPFKNENTRPMRLYIVQINIPFTDGTSRKVLKPGITSRSIFGDYGRYPHSTDVSLVFESDPLPPMIAWKAEQKLLRALPPPGAGDPSLVKEGGWHSGESFMLDLDSQEDLLLERYPDAIFTQPETYSLSFEERRDLRDAYMLLKEQRRAKSSQPDWNKLRGLYDGRTEWRFWPESEVIELIDYAELIINTCMAIS